MVQVTADEARERFDSLLEKVRGGAEVEITSNGDTVARLVPAEKTAKRGYGSAKGLFTVPDDFDDPLADFDEYTR